MCLYAPTSASVDEPEQQWPLIALWVQTASSCACSMGVVSVETRL